MGRRFKEADERVDEESFEDVLAVLAGASPWQDFIAANLKEARKNIPKHAFRVVDAKEFAKVMTALGDDGDNGSIPGVTDKKTGVITLQEFFGVNSHASFLGAALHETVHLVSHPAGKSAQGFSTARNALGVGLLEGLVECVTEDILNAQGIKLAKPERRGHKDRVPIARELMRIADASVLGPVLFGGEFRNFTTLMNTTFAPAGWFDIKKEATANNTKGAIKKIRDLQKAQAARNTPGQNQLAGQLAKGNPTTAPAPAPAARPLPRPGVCPPPR